MNSLPAGEASPLIPRIRSGLLRSRVTPGHGLDEVVGPAVGASGGSGDVGFAVAAVVSDGGVSQGCGDGGARSRAGPGGGFPPGGTPGPRPTVFAWPPPPWPGPEAPRVGRLRA